MKSRYQNSIGTILLVLVGCGSESRSTQSDRNEAKAALLQIATNQERFYLQSKTYTIDMTKLGFATTPSSVSALGSYEVSVEFADNQQFSAVAAHIGVDADTQDCRWLRIDSAGNKTSGPNTDCWIL